MHLPLVINMRLLSSSTPESVKMSYILKFFISRWNVFIAEYHDGVTLVVYYNMKRWIGKKSDFACLVVIDDHNLNLVFLFLGFALVCTWSLCYGIFIIFHGWNIDIGIFNASNFFVCIDYRFDVKLLVDGRFSGFLFWLDFGRSVVYISSEKSRYTFAFHLVEGTFEYPSDIWIQMPHFKRL